MLLELGVALLPGGEALPLSGLPVNDGLGILAEDDTIDVAGSLDDKELLGVGARESIVLVRLLEVLVKAILLVIGADVVRVLVELSDALVRVTLLKVPDEVELLAAVLEVALPFSGWPVNEGFGVLADDGVLVALAELDELALLVKVCMSVEIVGVGFRLLLVLAILESLKLIAEVELATLLDVVFVIDSLVIGGTEDEEKVALPLAGAPVKVGLGMLFDDEVELALFEGLPEDGALSV